MKYLLLLLLAVVTMAGCSKEPGRSDSEVAEPFCLVFTSYNNHKVITWVNDEPALVCDDVWTGYNKPPWLTFQKGSNRIHFTAKRLPKEVTAVFDNVSGVLTEDGVSKFMNDGTTTVKIIKGPVFQPEDLFTWKATKDSETSPTWTVNCTTYFRPGLEEFDNIETVDEKTKQQIADFLAKLRQALETKDVSSVGLRESDVKSIARAVGMPFSGFDAVFGMDHYEATVCPIDKLKIIHGKKTILVYCPNGDPIYRASRSADTPMENGKMYPMLASDVLYFVKKHGKLEPLWPKMY